MYAAYKINVNTQNSKADGNTSKHHHHTDNADNAYSMAGNPLKVIVFLGSVRENRLCSRVATFMKKQLEQAKYSVEVFGRWI